MEIRWWWGFPPMCCFSGIPGPEFSIPAWHSLSATVRCGYTRQLFYLPAIWMHYPAWFWGGAGPPSSYLVRDAFHKGISGLQHLCQRKGGCILNACFVSADNRTYFLNSYPSWTWHLWSVKSMQMLLKLNKYNGLVFHTVTFFNIYVIENVVSVVDLNMWLRNTNTIQNGIVLTIFYS